MSDYDQYWHAYCIDEGQVVSAWLNGPMVSCPNDGGHTLQAGSATGDLVAEQSLDLSVVNSITSLSYVPVSYMQYQGSDFFAPDTGFSSNSPKYIKVSSKIVGGSYDLRLVDQDGNVLKEFTGLTNTTNDYTVFDFDNLTGALPVAQNLLSVEARTSGLLMSVVSAVLYRRTANR